MMKKIVVILGALLLVVSGVAAVSAFESHLVNVTAHVENALYTNVPWPGGRLSFGTVFPQEFLGKNFFVRFSTSFSQAAQIRVEHLDYQVWVEAKPQPGGGFYPCLADAMYIGVQDILWTGPGQFATTPEVMDFRPTTVGGDLVAVGTCNLPVMVTSDTLSKVDVSPNAGVQWENHDDNIWVFIDVPVFQGYYNPLTDALGCDPTETTLPYSTTHKPSGLCTPTVTILTGDPRYDPGGTLNIVLGADVKIQVTNIYQ